MGTFGQRLRELRNLRGISQNELSKHIGVSKSSVNMYERGEREPSFETLEAIADFFNVNMDYLLGRDNTSDIQEAVNNIIARHDPNQLSNPAKLILSKLFRALVASDLSANDNEIRQVLREAQETFTLSEAKYVVEILNSAYGMLKDIEKEAEQVSLHEGLGAVEPNGGDPCDGRPP